MAAVLSPRSVSGRSGSLVTFLLPPGWASTGAGAASARQGGGKAGGPCICSSWPCGSIISHCGKLPIGVTAQKLMPLGSPRLPSLVQTLIQTGASQAPRSCAPARGCAKRTLAEENRFVCSIVKMVPIASCLTYWFKLGPGHGFFLDGSLNHARAKPCLSWYTFHPVVM